jgi:O-acetyl-ADP-ribose deacetylase (regulator of RNase III)
MGQLAIDGTLCAGGRVVVATGDITELAVDAIVNAANSALMGGGGVDGAIHRAGGIEILKACKAIRASRFPAGLPTGEAVITTAGDLPARAVIHTVGPVWHGGSAGEDELLAKAYRSTLEIAAGNKLNEIAFPAISTGVYGFPRARAAQVVHRTLLEFVGKNDFPRTIYLVFFSASDSDLYLQSTSCH